MDIYEEALKAHKKLKGKIEVVSKAKLTSPEDLSIYYSPGVGAVASYLADNPEKVSDYTSVNNSVAIISDGTSVLGLGNIGPQGALPVMEGKAVLFKEFAGIDAIPIVLSTQEPDKIIETIVNIAPSFGGINLEDFAAPNCFYIENELKKRLSIPLMHDDQHGTAIVVLAGLINAMKVTNRKLSDAKIVVVGAGAAGTAIVKLLNKYANPNIIVVDSKGVISSNRHDLNEEKRKLLEYSNYNNEDGKLENVLHGADVFIGVSKAGLLTPEMVRSMNKDPIIFALANPEPEILPELAIQAGASVVATGRSDYPNQVNNVLAFPGLFKGALETKSFITNERKMQAAEAIADIVKEPRADYIIPSVFDKKVVEAVSSVFKNN
ncbi:NADP-dependent malic enzyme [Candidatus Saccharibacteria bacterium]|nr:NADP-dependent malic enzyme [Candidatus Saccharibacteria bacterium]MBP7834601.1 NADP-dependent malic enzyme [Candidatus Saccharibacteria bacterium]